MTAPFDRTELITLAKGKATARAAARLLAKKFGREDGLAQAVRAAATELGKLYDDHTRRSEKARMARALRAYERDQSSASASELSSRPCCAGRFSFPAGKQPT